jgi:hypothetical protein
MHASQQLPGLCCGNCFVVALSDVFCLGLGGSFGSYVVTTHGLAGWLNQMRESCDRFSKKMRGVSGMHA